VVIDAGHGGIDGGTPAGKMVEKEWTLTVALALAEELKNRGHTVDLTRTTDETLPLIERPALVNAFPRTAMISIHFNADSSDASGIETCYSWPKRPEVMTQLQAAAGVSEETQLPNEGMALAQSIQTSVHEKTGARDRGIKNRTNLALTSRCLCPAVIVECGFLSNAEEGRLIRESSYRAKLVRGIADGYEAWLLNRSGGASATITPAATPDHREQLKPEDPGAEH
jgi:N-acetylmuramoyl-L-alanine amidase